MASWLVRTFRNIFNAKTGNGLTDSQRQAAALQQQYALEQQDHSAELERGLRQTQYQDTVDDMQAAGLNPAMMLGGSASASDGMSVGTAGGSAVHPAGGAEDLISMLFNLAQAGASISATRAKANLDNEYAKNQEFERSLLKQQADKAEAEAKLTEDMHRWYPYLQKATIDKLVSETSLNQSAKDLNVARTEHEKVLKDISEIDLDWKPLFNDLQAKLLHAQGSREKAEAFKSTFEAAMSKMRAAYMDKYGHEMPTPSGITGVFMFGGTVLKEILGVDNGGDHVNQFEDAFVDFINDIKDDDEFLERLNDRGLKPPKEKK